MKSAIFAGLLATVAVAQPHKAHQHQHQKKDVVVEWVTQWETVTEIIDDYQTQTIFPAPHSTTAAAPTSVAAPSSSSSADVAAKFVETLVPSSSTSQIVVPSSSTTPVVEVPSASSVALPAAPTTTLVPVVSIPSVALPAAAPTTTLAPVVSIPTVVAPAPAPSSTIQAAAAPAPSSGGSSSGSSLFSGDITYYVMGPTACGDDFTGQDSSVAVAALPYQYMGTASSYGPNQPANEHCGRTVEITANGKTVIAKVQDKCMGCEPQDIDVSEKVFLELFGTTGGGRLSAQWREIS